MTVIHINILPMKEIRFMKEGKIFEGEIKDFLLKNFLIRSEKENNAHIIN